MDSIIYGYIYHPAVLMWLGYEDALKEYLDAHIEATIARGIKNNMERYQVKNSLRPAWTNDTDFIERHRAVLLKKEIDRQEKPWYQLIPLFTNTSSIQHRPAPVYYWPYTSSIGKSAKTQGEADSVKKYQNEVKLPYQFQFKMKITIRRT